MTHFTEKAEQEQRKRNKKLDFAWQQYTGEYIEDENIQDYLNRKLQRESPKAYESRIEDSDPVLLFPTAVDGLNGILFAKDDETQREWGQLGDPEEPDSIAYSLKRNADGEGTNWNPLMKQVGIKETVLHEIWGLVEGVQTDGQGNTLQEATVKIIDPQSVIDRYPKSGNPEQVLVKESRDARADIRDDSDSSQDVYVLYELDGWTRFEVQEFEDGNGEISYTEKVLGQGEYEYWADNDRTKRILPIFPCELPMPRFVGYLLAKKQNHIFNKKSSRDWGVQIMSFALLKIVGTQEQFDAVMESLEKGANAIRQDPDVSDSHGYLSPQAGYLTEAGDILEKDKKNFYESAFKQYGNAAKQVTATEVRLESRSGIEAFLTLLVTSIDEFENDCLWRIEQVYFPDKPNAWGEANVKRTRDFQPKDIIATLESLGNVVLNADRAGAMSTKRKVELLNPEMSKSEIDEEVQRINKERGAVEVPSNQVGG